MNQPEPFRLVPRQNLWVLLDLAEEVLQAWQVSSQSLAGAKFCFAAYNVCMSKRNVNSMIKEIELTLSSIGSLPPDVQKAIEKLLNIVEILSHDNQSLKEEVSRLGKQLDKKK